MIDLYDSDIIAIQRVMDKLKSRHGSGAPSRNYTDIEREITERFADAGYKVAVSWYRYSVGGVEQEGSAMPEIDFIGRVEKHDFDHDRQVHEVTNNILEIPGATGVIKTDEGHAFKKFREESGHDHGSSHSHGHSHPHPH